MVKWFVILMPSKGGEEPGLHLAEKSHCQRNSVLASQILRLGLRMTAYTQGE